MKTNMVNISLLAVSALVIAAGAIAEEKADRQTAEAVAAKVATALSGDSKCPMKENAQLSITLNFMESNPKAAKDVMDKRSREVEETAKGVGVKSMELQNYNFNLYPQNNNNGFDAGATQYQVSGSLNFMIQPADKGVELMEKLLAMKIQSSLNVNGYRDSCPR